MAEAYKISIFGLQTKANTMHYHFSIPEAQTQYINIAVEINTTEAQTTLQFPTWRPGRYELGNFAKNVRFLKVMDAAGKEISAQKTSHSVWTVDTTNTETITVKYQYYAAELNAGSTFLDKTQLYVNPVNCCLYSPAFMDEKCTLTFDVPETWQLASSFDKDGDVYSVKDVHELMDTPFIWSPNLQMKTYEVADTLFYVWFNGEVKPQWDKIIKDFKAFTEKQIEKFTEFPVKEYHFIFQIVPYKLYHGVEHQKSTVIALGPSYAVFEELYTEFLGVSSHELYHTWNVKAIRPIEMMPYDYSKENYSPMGYLCEGVTTYLGDLFLMKSGVFDIQQYFKEMGTQLQRHFDNHGRFNHSVAESSFDTWLDGYVPGAPGRKVSIYVEGCLLAFVTDVMIRRYTDDKRGLDDVMRQLFVNHGLKNIGVSEADYKAAIENVAGVSFDWLFNEYIHGTKGYEAILFDCFEYLGIEMLHEPSKKYSEGRLGFKVLESPTSCVLKAIYPGGPADMAGAMLEDNVVAVNNCKVNGDLNKWLTYFDDDIKVLTVERKGQLVELTMPEVQRYFYSIYDLKLTENPDKNQKKALEWWSK